MPVRRTTIVFAQSAAKSPSKLGGGMASGGLEAIAPNVNLSADNVPQKPAGWFIGDIITRPGIEVKQKSVFYCWFSQLHA